MWKAAGKAAYDKAKVKEEAKKARKARQKDARRKEQWETAVAKQVPPLTK